MAFWGVEVKPGKPFTHSFDSLRGRLRISQATLAIGSSTKKSLVQCNVGDKSPVLLCALLPDKTESCQLDLEFEEAVEVVFSVIGPRSVHLTGYYVGSSRNSKPDDESESYGEDIANTDTEEHNRSSDDDEYDDSFINDDDPEVLPPSPASSDGVDEVVETKKPSNRKTVHKRLKKRYQSVESDDDDVTTSKQKHNDIKSSRAAIQESESEDDIPISSIFNTKGNAKNTVEEKTLFNTKTITKNMVEEKTNKETVENVEKMAEDDVPKGKEDPQGNSLPPLKEVGHENKTKQKKKKKQQDKETATNGRTDLPHNSLVPSSEIAPENGMKTKKKRKERSKEEKNHIADSEEVSENSQKSKKRRKEVAREEKSHEDKSPSLADVRNQQDQKPSSESEKKNKKKRNKNIKILENDENFNIDVPLSPKESKDKNVNIVSSKARTLSNGLIIEDLEFGRTDGKIAALGKKVKIHYIGKLKDNGQTIDSNIGKSPFRFRLGDKEIIEGWNLGLDGMRAGDKRRLVIPPTLSYASQGTGENIPPNSWLVYDIELVSVH